jgi:Ca-activated chloride channel family protein
MKKIIFLLFLTTLTLFAMAKKQHKDNSGVDDWDYNATIQMDKLKKISRHMPMATMAGAPAPMMKMSTKSIGFSVGGAKDSDNFYQNLKNGYLPKLKSITYEGVFYDHYFQSPENGTCENLFCPTYTTKTTENLYTKDKEHYLSVGLDSNIKPSDFQRKKLNIVVVLDISGSMSSPFNRYYYDKKNSANDEESKLSKMQIANKALVGMIDHLANEDRLGVVLFDNNSYNAKPLRLIKETNIKATQKHILELKPRGGTNWSAGYKSGLALFNSVEDGLKDPNIYENRVIFITDAMPNQGELSENGLFGLVKSASKDGIYTTFIGVGVDFNNDLVEAVSKTRGANYFAVHSSKEFLKRMDEEFDYMVTPLVFDLKLKLLSQDNEIEAVYGSPDANRATGEIMYVNTLFPSPTKDGKTKGGVILLKVKHAKDMQLRVSYKDRAGKSYESTKKVSFKNSSNQSIEKAILLSNFVTLMQNFLIDHRESCHDKINRNIPIFELQRKCMIYPPDRPEFQMVKTWERESCPLKVNEGYKKLLPIFLREFKRDSSKFQDDLFEKELKALELILEKKSNLTDDWKSHR